MKVCPQCGYSNNDDYDFCVVDGTQLDGTARMYVSLDPPEQETRWVPKPPSSPMRASATAARPGFIYVLIGALGSAVLLLGAYVVLAPRESNETEKNAVVNTTPIPGANILTEGERTNINRAPSNAPNSATNALSAAAKQAEIAANANASNKPANRVERAYRFDRTYEGSVGDGSVTMTLQRNGNNLSGRVFPYGRSGDIYVSGYISDDGTFSMDEKSDIGVVTGVYNGLIHGDGTITGTWAKPGGNKSRSIYLTRR